MQTRQKAKIGTRFVFGGGKLKAEIIDVLEDGNRIARFECEENFFATLDEIGQMPLPPYITEKLKDKDRYQTVYAHELGSSAAPTAGLHFTEQQLEDLKAMGVNIAYVTLHVGLGTFRPVKEDKVLDHKMHREHYELSRETADMINETKKMVDVLLRWVLLHAGRWRAWRHSMTERSFHVTVTRRYLFIRALSSRCLTDLLLIFTCLKARLLCLFLHLWDTRTL